METIELIHGDCLEKMKDIESDSIDMICCDMPYGTTNYKWDSTIDLQLMWDQYKRITKDNAAIVLFAQTPFDKVLGCSNLEWLRYEIIWEKPLATGHLNAKKMPMKAHENILVFYKKLPAYTAQKTTGHKPVNSYTKHQQDGDCYGKTKIGIKDKNGIQIRLGDKILAGAKDYKGNISGWSKEIVAYEPKNKEIVLSNKNKELMEMPINSECLEIYS